MNDDLGPMLQEMQELLEKLTVECPQGCSAGTGCSQCWGTGRIPDPAYDGLREVAEWRVDVFGWEHLPAGALSGALEEHMPENVALEADGVGRNVCGWQARIWKDGEICVTTDSCYRSRDIASLKAVIGRLKAVISWLEKEAERAGHN